MQCSRKRRVRGNVIGGALKTQNKGKWGMWGPCRVDIDVVLSRSEESLNGMLHIILPELTHIYTHITSKYTHICATYIYIYIWLYIYIYMSVSVRILSGGRIAPAYNCTDIALLGDFCNPGDLVSMLTTGITISPQT